MTIIKKPTRTGTSGCNGRLKESTEGWWFSFKNGKYETNNLDIIDALNNSPLCYKSPQPKTTKQR